jgi:flagellar biosynthetic protein FliP
MNLGVITLLFLFPLFLLATSFTRIFIVLSFIRKGLGEIALPSGQIMFGLALLFSFLIMNEPIQKIYDQSVTPFLEGKKSGTQAIKESETPLREFMSSQVSKNDLEFVTQYTKSPAKSNKSSTPFMVLLGAFSLSELKKGLFLGFIIWVPFLIIDLLSSLIISTLSLHSLNVQIVSIPLKILLFLALDGWKLLFGTIAESYWVR